MQRAAPQEKGGRTRYEEVADTIRLMIDQEIYRAGDRIPSVRELSRQFNVSVTTVLQAYSLLEDRGLIKARPQSGYYVNGKLPAVPPAPIISRPSLKPTSVSNSEISLSILQASTRPGVIPLGAAITNPDLLPIDRLNRMLCSTCRRHPVQSVSYDVPPGCERLRVQIARRSLAMGVSIAPEEIVTTSGCLEAVHLALRATCRPGDVVAVESPTYYNFLLLIDKLELRALEIPCDPVHGVSLDALRYAIEQNNIKACLFNLNFNNPIGSLMSESRKKELVELLETHDIPLIEDDIHGDLTFVQERPKTTRVFARKCMVLLCSSFSKTLAPGYRVGWIAPGRFQAQVEQLKVVTSVSTSSPPQLAIAEFLANGGYDRLLRKLQRTYASQMVQMAEAVGRYFPKGTCVTRPAGGFVLWIELPEQIDSFRLYEQALRAGISIAPGPIFSAKGKYRNCIRLNAAFWSPKIEQGIETLGTLAESLNNNPE